MKTPSIPPITVSDAPLPGHSLFPEDFDTWHHQSEFGDSYEGHEAFRRRQLADMRVCLGMMTHSDRDPLGLVMDALQLRITVGFIFDNWEDREAHGSTQWTAEEILAELRSHWDPTKHDLESQEHRHAVHG